jgi:ATP-dependent Zn protease
MASSLPKLPMHSTFVIGKDSWDDNLDRQTEELKAYVNKGGRVAEEIIFDDITTGASQDIKQATGIAKSMVTKFGMSEALGLVSYGDDNDEVFIGRDFGHTSRGYEEKPVGDNFFVPEQSERVCIGG